MKSHRTPAGSSMAITEFKKRNNRYMSPGPATLPRPRSKPTRSAVTNLSAREQAAERRRRLADVWQQSQAAQLRERGARIVTRDQEVVQWADGSTLRQPKKHWRGSWDDVVELDYIDDILVPTENFVLVIFELPRMIFFLDIKDIKLADFFFFSSIHFLKK